MKGFTISLTTRGNPVWSLRALNRRGQCSIHPQRNKSVSMLAVRVEEGEEATDVDDTGAGPTVGAVPCKDCRPADSRLWLRPPHLSWLGLRQSSKDNNYIRPWHTRTHTCTESSSNTATCTCAVLGLCEPPLESNKSWLELKLRVGHVFGSQSARLSPVK